jgi:hypothetical protein
MSPLPEEFSVVKTGKEYPILPPPVRDHFPVSDGSSDQEVKKNPQEFFDERTPGGERSCGRNMPFLRDEVAKKRA